MKTKTSLGPRLNVLGSMVIFGTVGLFVRYIGIDSGVIAFSRGLIGMAFLLLVTAVSRKRLSWRAIFKKMPLLVASSVALGLNWILLFEAYRYTTVATATLCYYFAPMFIILASPFILRERITAKKLLCVLAALLGMVFVSGVVPGGLPTKKEALGIALGLAAAVLYATVVLLNKQLGALSAMERTVTQLGLSALILLPYLLLTGAFQGLALDLRGGVLLLTVGIVHTGVAYALYFGSLHALKAQTAAIFSYVDPVVAILLSALILKETMHPLAVLGAVLILGSALVSELPNKKEQG